MHTVELLESALLAATQAGYRIRREWLGGMGGACELRGQKWIFLDEGLTPAEQLELVLDALRRDATVAREMLSPELGRVLRRAA